MTADLSLIRSFQTRVLRCATACNIHPTVTLVKFLIVPLLHPSAEVGGGTVTDVEADDVRDGEVDDVGASISRPILSAAFKASSISRACCSMTMSISSRAAKSRRRYTSVRLTPANMMNRVARSLGSSNVAAKPCCSSSLHVLRAVMLRRGERRGASVRGGWGRGAGVAGLGSRG